MLLVMNEVHVANKDDFQLLLRPRELVQLVPCQAKCAWRWPCGILLEGR